MRKFFVAGSVVVELAAEETPFGRVGGFTKAVFVMIHHRAEKKVEGDDHIALVFETCADNGL